MSGFGRSRRGQAPPLTWDGLGVRPPRRGSLGRFSPEPPPGTSSGHGMVFSWQWQGTQRWSRTREAQAQSWAAVASFSPSWPEKALWPRCRGPCCARREDTCLGPGMCLPMGSRNDSPVPSCIGPLNRNHSHSCFSPRKLTSDRASKPAGVEVRMTTRLVVYKVGTTASSPSWGASVSPVGHGVRVRPRMRFTQSCRVRARLRPWC